MIRFNSPTRLILIAVCAICTMPDFRRFANYITSTILPPVKLDGQERRYQNSPELRIVGKYGFVNRTGVQAVPSDLDKVSNYSQGFAAVKKGGLWSIIDKSGKMMVKPRSGAIMQVLPNTFVEGLTPLEIDNERWGFVNKHGEWVIKPQFEEVEPFDNGLARVCIKGKYGYIDSRGKRAVPIRFASLGSFHKGLALAFDENGSGLITTDGVWKVLPKYQTDNFDDDSDVYGDGVFVLARANEYATSGDPITYDCFDTDGRLLFTSIAQRINPFAKGFAAFQKDGNWGLMNKQGIVVVKPIFDEIVLYENGLWAGNTDDQWQYFDPAGARMRNIGSQPMVPIDKPEFSEGLAPVRLNQSWGFVNTSGNFVIEPRFDEVGDFHDGMAWVLRADTKKK